MLPSDILDRGFEACKQLFENFSASWDESAKQGAKAALDTATKGNPYNPQTHPEEYAQWFREHQNLGNALKTAGSEVEGRINAFNPVGILCYLIAIAMVLFAHFWIALQLFLTIIEFYIFAALSTIFIPFGVFRHTKFLFDQTIRGLVSFGCKMMGTFFLIAVISNSLNFIDSTKVIPASKQFSYYLRVGLVYLSLAFLVWKLPDKFAGLLSGGGPSMSAGELTGGTKMVYARTRQAGSMAMAPVAAVAGAAVAGLAMKAGANANKRKYDELGTQMKDTQTKIGNSRNQISSLDKAIAAEYSAEQAAAQRVKTAGSSEERMEALSAQMQATNRKNALMSQRDREQSKMDGLQSEYKAAKAKQDSLGSQTFKGMFGTKIGAKITEGWVGRRENLNRDSTQWDAFKTGNYENIRPDYYQH